MQQLLVSKQDISQTKIIASPSPELGDGEARLKIDRFALTANNITYAVAGETMNYWNFFPTPEEGWGNVPVWGQADVVESRCDGISVGERLYGYFPMAEELIVRPTRIRDRAFIDGTAHRAGLSPVYNEYVRLNLIPDHDPSLEDLQAILYPLYATSYMIYDYLLDNDYFGAEQILVGSASSKTALGLLELLSMEEGPHPAVIGLTSGTNKEFMVDRKICDKVVTYDRITEEVGRKPSVYVDMSGNSDIRTTIHTHLGDQLRLSSAVGISHWDKFGPARDLPGPKPEMFFAPAQIKKRHDEWGPGVIQGKTMNAWRTLAAKSKSWLTVKREPGLDGAATVYAALIAGTTSPTDGYIIYLG